MVSFDETQVITRLIRSAGKVVGHTVDTDTVEADAKLQSKLDDRGAHDFLFCAGAVFCEGKDDTSAARLGFEKLDVDCDGRAISVTQVGSVNTIPAFAQISCRLGIRWCALTDQDLQQNGVINPKTESAREKIEKHRGANDKQVQWPVSLESCLGVTSGKATPEISLMKLSEDDWHTKYPEFKSVLAEIAAWIDPAISV
jgi:hypothetical protein